MARRILPSHARHPAHPLRRDALPLCGGDNRCAVEIEKATGEPQPPCWCVSETFSPELLARIPEAARRR